MLNIEYFNAIKEIKSLFSSNTYTEETQITDNEKIKIVLKKKDNIEDKYIIEIDESNIIKVEIPIKNSNYKYRTILNDLWSVYNYLYIHTK
tara:strand:+ start:327 stop:599 length:273 start_codon:yes stop_codon:yes gene_type:complete